MENVAKNISVPQLNSLSKVKQGRGNIERVGLPRGVDKVREGRVLEPHGFKAKGALSIIVGGQVSVHKNRVVVQGGTREVHDSGFLKKELPLKIGKGMV